MILLVVLFLLNNKSLATEDCACKFEIEYQELGTAQPPCVIPTTQIIYNDNLRTEIVISSCNGQAEFKSYDRKSNELRISGSFIAGIDCYVRTDTTYFLNEEDYTESIAIVQTTFCKPLKDGEWHYYND